MNHLQVFATTMGGNSFFKGVTLFWRWGNKQDYFRVSET